MTYSTGIGLALEMSGHIMPVKVAWVGVGIVADFASVSVTILDTKAADGNGCSSLGGTCQHSLRGALGVKAC